MKTKLKIAAIVFIVLLVAMVLFAMLGLQEATNLKINDVDLSAVADGDYTGTYQNGRFSNTATVTVLDHTITNIVLKNAANNGLQNTRTLIDRVLEQQRPDVDVVAGATATSNGLLKAVEIALTEATAK